MQAISEEAEREITALPEDIQARYLHVVGLLEEFGPQRVGMPHVRPLGVEALGDPDERRAGIARAIYFAARGRRLVVVRAFVKKTEKTPRREIELAARRMEEYGGG